MRWADGWAGASGRDGEGVAHDGDLNERRWHFQAAQGEEALIALADEDQLEAATETLVFSAVGLGDVCAHVGGDVSEFHG